MRIDRIHSQSRKQFPKIPTATIRYLRGQGFRKGIQFAMETINHRLPLYTFPEPLQQLYIFLREVLEHGKPKHQD